MCIWILTNPQNLYKIRNLQLQPITKGPHYKIRNLHWAYLCRHLGCPKKWFWRTPGGPDFGVEIFGGIQKDSKSQAYKIETPTWSREWGWFPKPCHGGPRLTKSTLFRYNNKDVRMNSYEDLSLVKGMIICSGISSTHHQLTTVRLSMSRTAFLNILREWEAICMCACVCVCQKYDNNIQQPYGLCQSMSLCPTLTVLLECIPLRKCWQAAKGHERPPGCAEILSGAFPRPCCRASRSNSSRTAAFVFACSLKSFFLGLSGQTEQVWVRLSSKYNQLISIV